MVYDNLLTIAQTAFKFDTGVSAKFPAGKSIILEPIRVGDPEHVELVREIYDDLLVRSFIPRQPDYDYIKARITNQSPEDRLNLSEFIIWAIRSGETLTGIVRLNEVQTDGEPFYSALQMLEEFRGQRIGSMALFSSLLLARASGLQRFKVGCMPTNKTSLKLCTRYFGPPDLLTHQTRLGTFEWERELSSIASHLDPIQCEVYEP